MKRNVILGTMLLVAGSLLAADADKDAVKSAAKKLMDSSYSWKQSSENAGGNGGGGGRGGGGGPQEGKAGKDGTFWVSVTFGQNSRESFIKGDKSVSKNQDGEWQTPEEAAAARAAAGNGNGGGRGRGRGNMFANFKGPAAQLADLVDAAKDLKTDEGVVVGDFTEDGAKKFMTFGGGRGRRGGGGGTPPEISGAKGSVKFWVKDGAVTKVEYHVTGTISFNGNDRDVDRTTTIEFKDIGSTTVTIPEEAAKKLS